MTYSKEPLLANVCTCFGGGGRAGGAGNQRRKWCRSITAKKKFLRQLSQADQCISATLSDSPGNTLKVPVGTTHTFGAGCLESAFRTSFPSDCNLNSFESQVTWVILIRGPHVWGMSLHLSLKGHSRLQGVKETWRGPRADKQSWGGGSYLLLQVVSRLEKSSTELKLSESIF